MILEIEFFECLGFLILLLVVGIKVWVCRFFGEFMKVDEGVFFCCLLDLYCVKVFWMVFFGNLIVFFLEILLVGELWFSKFFKFFLICFNILF